jgi:ionotropic glutamate receptor
MPVLLLAGAWGLAVFLLTNYYTTLLISFVAAPNHHPLIQSIFDLRNRPDLRLVTDKNINIDIILSVFQ